MKKKIDCIKLVYWLYGITLFVTVLVFVCKVIGGGNAVAPY